MLKKFNNCSIDRERLSTESPLGHFRFCRSLINQKISPLAMDAAISSLYAKRYQPSMAALHILSHIGGRPSDPIHLKLFASKAPMGDCDGFDQAYRLLPLPIARETAQLFEEIGIQENNVELIQQAKAAKEWVSQWGHSNPLFYRESEFDESEIVEEALSPVAYGSDDLLGIVRLSTPTYHAALTLSGWNTGLGVIKFGDVEIRAFGPQPYPLSDPSEFGLAQIGAQGPIISADQDHFSLQGWTRCFQNQQLWLSLQATADSAGVRADVRFVGIKPNLLSDQSSVDPHALVFYVKAASCTLEDGSVLYPKGLSKFQGKGQKVIFDQTMQIECSQIMNLQVIPLVGSGCFWNTTFLVAFEFNASQDQVSFTIVRKE